MLRAQGEAEAIQTVFNAIHLGNPDDKLLAYQYLQTLPKIADSASSKLWIIPSEFTEALKGMSGAFAGVDRGCREPRRREQAPSDAEPPAVVTHRWFEGAARAARPRPPRAGDGGGCRARRRRELVRRRGGRSRRRVPTTSSRTAT